jgi:hypothetical protein
MESASRGNDVLRLRFGLGLSLIGASATAVRAGLWLARILGNSFAQDSTVILYATWWLGVSSQAVGALLLASGSASRRVGVLAWASFAAFVAEFFAGGIALGTGRMDGLFHGAVKQVTFAWMECSAWIGMAALAVATARIGAQRYSLARRVGIAAPVAIGAAAVAQRVAPIWAGEAPAVVVLCIAQALGSAAVAIGATTAWFAIPTLVVDIGRGRTPADAILAIPIIFAVRGAFQVTAWVLAASPWDEGIAPSSFDEALGLVTIACVVAMAAAPSALRARWAWIGLSLVAAGYAAIWVADDGPRPLMAILSRASFADLGAGTTANGLAPGNAEAIAHLAGVGSNCAMCLAIAAFGRAVGEVDGERRIRSAIGPLLVAAAASIRLPSVASGNGALLALFATGSFGLGTFRLAKGCIAIGRAVSQWKVPVAARNKADDIANADDGTSELETHAPNAGPTGSNPYAAPSSKTTTPRGKLGGAKLGSWRARVRGAIPWIIAPPFACSAVTVILVLPSALARSPTLTADMFLRVARGMGSQLVVPVSLSHVLARALTLGGVFAATATPRRRLHPLGAWARRTTRVAASTPLAAWGACAFLAMAYGPRGAAGLAFWLAPIDNLAYCVIAFYGAQLFAAGDKRLAASIAGGLALAFGVLALVGFVLAAGEETSLPAAGIDAFAEIALAVGAVAIGARLRHLLANDDALPAITANVVAETTATCPAAPDDDGHRSSPRGAG